MSKKHRLPHVLLLVDTAGAFGRGIVEGIGRYARENGPWSIQYEYRARDSLPPQWIKQWPGDGIISRTVSLEQAKLLRATKLPLVELHGHPQARTAEVNVDVPVEACMAIDHFLDCGLRNFGFFTFGKTWWVDVHRERYVEELKKRGYSRQIYEAPVFDDSVPVWSERQRPGLIQWLKSLKRPIGIFTLGDLHSMRLLDQCRELNIAVPEEIAILGLGNDPVICETVHPTLSSMDLNARRIGYEAAGLLDRKMAGKTRQKDIAVAPSHVAVRQSSDLMAIQNSDVAQAVRFIRQFACKGIDVSCVAKEVGLSRTSLEQRFHQYLGRTPAAEIMRVRMEHAKLLLSQTDHTSESIAHKSGFTSLKYFTRAFCREVGITPAAYRKAGRISRDAL